MTSSVKESPVKETNGSAKEAAVEEKAAENGNGDSVAVEEPAAKENGDAAKEEEAEEVKENGSGKILYYLTHEVVIMANRLAHGCSILTSRGLLVFPRNIHYFFLVSFFSPCRLLPCYSSPHVYHNLKNSILFILTNNNNLTRLTSVHLPKVL